MNGGDWFATAMLWLFVGMGGAYGWAVNFSEGEDKPTPRDVRWMMLVGLSGPCFIAMAAAYWGARFARWIVSDLWPKPKPVPFREPGNYRESAK